MNALFSCTLLRIPDPERNKMGRQAGAKGSRLAQMMQKVAKYLCCGGLCAVKDFEHDADAATSLDETKVSQTPLWIVAAGLYRRYGPLKQH